MRHLLKKFILSMAVGLFVTTSAFVSNAAGVLDTAVLNPASTGNSYTDEVVNITLSSLTTPNMSTTEKVQACYSFLVNSCSLDNMGSFTYMDRMTEEQRCHAAEMSDDQFHTYGMLLLHTGDCYGYTSAFVSLTRAIGLDSYMVYGLQVNNNGKKNNHAWCEINVNGVTYIFDPDIDDHISKGGANQNLRFCLEASSVSQKYQPYPIEDMTLYENYVKENPYSRNMPNAAMTLLY